MMLRLRGENFLKELVFFVVAVSLVRIHCVLVFFSMNTALPVSCPLFFLPLLRYFTFTIHIRKFLEKFYSKDLFDESLNICFLGVSIYLSYASYLIRRTFRLSCICNLNIILTSHSFPMRPLRSLLVHALVSPLSPGSRRPLPYATPAHSLQLASCCVSALYDHVKRPISFWCLRVCLRLFRFSCCFPASDP